MESTTQRYSCYTCHTHFELDVTEKEPVCPKCGEVHIMKRCEADPAGGCTCPGEFHTSIKYCPVCKQPVCPGCNDHDVVQVSRVTGYLSDVAGWNAAKKQELRDRQHYNLT